MSTSVPKRCSRWLGIPCTLRELGSEPRVLEDAERETARLRLQPSDPRSQGALLRRTVHMARRVVPGHHLRLENLSVSHEVKAAAGIATANEPVAKEAAGAGRARPVQHARMHPRAQPRPRRVVRRIDELGIRDLLGGRRERRAQLSTQNVPSARSASARRARAGSGRRLVRPVAGRARASIAVHSATTARPRYPAASNTASRSRRGSSERRAATGSASAHPPAASAAAVTATNARTRKRPMACSESEGCGCPGWAISAAGRG